MDMVGACRIFLAVNERGSFTLGAAAARVPQPVASRRIAALEEHLGERLFDRSPRGLSLTSFGKDMLPSARRLVALAERMEHDAEHAKARPLRLAVPRTCTTVDVARLIAEARDALVLLDVVAGEPAEREDLVRAGEAGAAVVAVAPGEAVWSVPLGLAAAEEPSVDSIYIETLRTSRADEATRARRIWMQPEDDVPHVRDRIERLRDSVGLRPGQVVLAGSVATAAAQVIGTTDLLLCSSAQAEELGLHWRPIGEMHLMRGFDVSAGAPADAERARGQLGAAIARCLGARPAVAAR